MAKSEGTGKKDNSVFGIWISLSSHGLLLMSSTTISSRIRFYVMLSPCNLLQLLLDMMCSVASLLSLMIDF